MIIAPREPLRRSLSNILAVRNPLGVCYRHTPDVACLVAYTSYLWLLCTFPARVGVTSARFADGGDWRTLALFDAQAMHRWCAAKEAKGDEVALGEADLGLLGVNVIGQTTTLTVPARDASGDRRATIVIRELFRKEHYRQSQPEAGTFALSPEMLALLGKLKSESPDHPVDCKIVALPGVGRQGVAFVKGPNIFGIAPAVDRATAAEVDLLTPVDGNGPMSWMW
jgi:hypothetical protein